MRIQSQSYNQRERFSTARLQIGPTEPARHTGAIGLRRVGCPAPILLGILVRQATALPQIKTGQREPPTRTRVPPARLEA